jgi:hypothetical protein
MIDVQCVGVCTALGAAAEDDAGSLLALMRRVKMAERPFERVKVRHAQGQLGPFGLDTGQWVVGGAVVEPPTTLPAHLAELLRVVVERAHTALQPARAPTDRDWLPAPWLVTLPDERVPSAGRAEVEAAVRTVLMASGVTEVTRAARPGAVTTSPAVALRWCSNGLFSAVSEFTGASDTIVAMSDTDLTLQTLVDGFLSHRLSDAGDGWIPAEASACVRLSAKPSAAGAARIAGAANASSADEVGNPKRKGSALALAMATAMQQGRVDAQQIGAVVCDADFDRVTAEELSLGVSRLGLHVNMAGATRWPVWYPSLSFGSTGVVGSTLAVLLGGVALEQQWVSGKAVLCVSLDNARQSSPTRTAFCVTRTDGSTSQGIGTNR